jgi:hypothetical protein
MKRLASLSLVLVGMLFAGHSAAAAGPPPKPCEFFAKQTAEAIFGAPLDPGQEKVMNCAYSAGGDDEKGLMVDFIPSAGASAGMSVADAYDNLIHQDPTATDVPVSGLGERADFLTSKDHTQATVQVMYHGAIVGILVTSSPNPNIKAALIEAVRQMMQKL